MSVATSAADRRVLRFIVVPPFDPSIERSTRARIGQTTDRAGESCLGPDRDLVSQLTRAAHDESRRDDDPLRWPGVAAHPREQQLRAGAPELGRVVADDRHRRGQQVGQLEVVEADEPDRPVERAQGPDDPDTAAVVLGEDRRRRVVAGKELACGDLGKVARGAPNRTSPGSNVDPAASSAWR